jgi:hypothetical protein
MPDGATINAQVATSSAAPIGERQNKTPIYVKRSDGHSRLPGMVTGLVSEWAVRSDEGGEAYACSRIAEGFRATVSALLSLDGNKGVSFHAFSLPEDRCVRLVVKNLGRHVSEDDVREELESLGICPGSPASPLGPL